MMKEFFDEEKFENLNFQTKGLSPGDYDNCSFINCDFTRTDLSVINFLECEFIQCNLSLAKLTDTIFQDVRFLSCKLTGLHFDDCNKVIFSVTFDNCSLDVCSFYKLKMKGTCFRNSKIAESDFEETDLSSAIFDTCDLTKSLFNHTNLEKTNFRTAFNYSIDPELNNIKKAMFSLHGITGLLDKYDIDIE
ncbi:MAG TPA: pentapeptide repeat-containing protein [Bacteroidales bacterium]|nr:pentapeptide repeat-containing protein [Bacteroidales bacterium]